MRDKQQKQLLVGVVALLGFALIFSGALGDIDMGMGTASSTGMIGTTPRTSDDAGSMDEIEEGQYNYKDAGIEVLVTYSATDKAGNNINPEGYAYTEKPGDWGNEEQLGYGDDDAKLYNGAYSLNFSSGETTALFTPGDEFHYHWTMDGYKDQYTTEKLPLTGDLRPDLLQSEGRREKIVMVEYDSTAWTSSAVNFSVDDNYTAHTFTERIYQDATDNQEINPGNLVVTNVAKDDIDEMTLTLSGGNGEVEIPIVSTSGDLVTYEGATDEFVFDSEDHESIDSEIREIIAGTGDNMKLELEIVADTLYNSASSTSGNGYWEYNASTSDVELAGYLTVDDIEGTTLIDDQPLSPA